MNINHAEVAKKQKKVNRNGWMANVQRYAWGREPRFTGYCPFFWATWIAVLCCVPVFIGRTLKGGLSFLRDAFSSGQEIRKIASIRQPSNFEIVKMFRNLEQGYYDMSDSNGLVAYIKWIVNAAEDSLTFSIYSVPPLQWALVNPEWQTTHYPQALLEVERVEAERAAIEKAIREAQRARKERLSKYQDAVVGFLSKLIWPVGIVAGIIALYYGAQSILGLIELFSLAAIGNFLLLVLKGIGIILAAVLGIAIVAGLGLLIIEGVKTIRRLIVQNSKGLQVVSNAAIGVAECFSFITETVEMFYKKECPLIEWADESGPIEKRDIEVGVGKNEA